MGAKDTRTGTKAAAPSFGNEEPGPIGVDADAVSGAALEKLFSDLAATPAGLSSEEARTRLKRFGLNDAATAKRVPLWLQFLQRLGNPLVIILLTASSLSAVTGDISSFLIVLLIVLASITLDFVQEVHAQNAVEELRRSVALRATVRRDGKTVSLPAEGLVPGDIVQLIAGDLVPADSRLLEGRDLYVNEALLTGEPYPSEKSTTAPASGSAASDRSNAVFAGTSVVSGTATILVCRTGKNTALGSLATSLAEKPPATAFAVGIRRFGLLIMRLTVLMVLFVVTVNVFFHRPILESLTFALALAVGLTPELLPMIVTVTLARSAIDLAKRKVIVRRLTAIHDIGAMDVLCTDKTGTLTEATIRLVRTIDGSGTECERTFAYAYVNSHYESGMKSPLDDAIVQDRAFDMSGWEKIDEVPFDFERRRVSVLVSHNGRRVLIVKGAPEEILRLSGWYEAQDGAVKLLDPAMRARFQATLDDLCSQGLRSLAIAIRAADPGHESAAVATDESDLVFSGFAVFLDPPKTSAGETIRAMAESGVAVKVLTGDNEAVARHVFAELGIPVTGTLTGDVLSQLPDEALIGQVEQVNLFARVNPQQKHRILLALKRLHHVVGFMGDGINDAPALHASDVGISVDGAADVARAAADLILLEHDLSVVREAVDRGRRTVQNVSKYVLMGSSSNFGNMFSMAGAALFLPFLPMLPVQILLNNLLYDISEIAIPFDSVDPEATARPVRWDVGLIERFMLVFGPMSSVFDFLTFYALIAIFNAGAVLFHTGWFIESVTTQVLVVFAIRTRRPFFRSRPHRFLVAMAFAAVATALVLPYVPFVSGWLGFVPPPPLFFVYLLLATGAYLGLVEATKAVFYRWMNGTRSPHGQRANIEPGDVRH